MNADMPFHFRFLFRLVLHPFFFSSQAGEGAELEGLLERTLVVLSIASSKGEGELPGRQAPCYRELIL